MARARIQVPEGVELVLSLTPKEAEALRGAMQNALYEDEPEELSSVRFAIWNALNRTPTVDDLA